MSKMSVVVLDVLADSMVSQARFEIRKAHAKVRSAAKAS